MGIGEIPSSTVSGKRKTWVLGDRQVATLSHFFFESVCLGSDLFVWLHAGLCVHCLIGPLAFPGCVREAANVSLEGEKGD